MERDNKKSDFLFTVWDDKKLVGMGRIVEDGVMCMFYDITVRKDYQGAGMGKKIMKELINHVKGRKYVFIGLFTNDKSFNFYKKFGFVNSKGMELRKYMDLPKKFRNL